MISKNEFLFIFGCAMNAWGANTSIIGCLAPHEIWFIEIESIIYDAMCRNMSIKEFLKGKTVSYVMRWVCESVDDGYINDITMECIETNEPNRDKGFNKFALNYTKSMRRIVIPKYTNENEIEWDPCLVKLLKKRHIDVDMLLKIKKKLQKDTKLNRIKTMVDHGQIFIENMVPKKEYDDSYENAEVYVCHDPQEYEKYEHICKMVDIRSDVLYEVSFLQWLHSIVYVGKDKEVRRMAVHRSPE